MFDRQQSVGAKDLEKKIRFCFFFIDRSKKESDEDEDEETTSELTNYFSHTLTIEKVFSRTRQSTLFF